MKVRISFVGKVQQYAGDESFILQLPDTADVTDLFRELTRQKPALSEIMRFLFVSVNQVMAPRNRILKDGDEVALFFRMGGG
ncbi:MAG TPA: MoaD/ThiS family protein [Anaerolineaceae bacterium]|nr:MoaD/ThiS family protein [Anaerolineaceae bacterium]